MRMPIEHKSLRCGEVARLTGVSADTIRHYERIGILPKSPRTSAGYRTYDSSALERVQLVQRAMPLGFTLAELAEIFGLHDKGEVPCQRVFLLTETKLHLLEQQIEELHQTRLYMRRLVRQWQTKLARTKPGSKAMLLHSIGVKGLGKTLKAFKRRPS